jgi:hypothetical protein
MEATSSCPRLLHNGDIHTMAFSVEARLPFADNNVPELSRSTQSVGENSDMRHVANQLIVTSVPSSNWAASTTLKSRTARSGSWAPRGAQVRLTSAYSLKHVQGLGLCEPAPGSFVLLNATPRNQFSWPEVINLSGRQRLCSLIRDNV